MVIYVIERYEIKVINGEDVLVLHLNFNEEFGGGSNNESLLQKVINFIKNNNIKYMGKKIALATFGVIVCTMLLSSPVDVNAKSDFFNFKNNIVQLDLSDRVIDLKKEINKVKPQVMLNKIEKKEVAKKVTPIKKVSSVKKSTSKVNSAKKVTSNKSTSKKNSIAKKTTSVKKTSSSVKKNSTSNKSSSSSTKKVVNRTVTVHRSNGKVVKMSLEDYVVGVVAAEMPASFSNEALKAQAVAARTYAMYLVNSGKKLTDTVSTQVYKDKTQLKKMWGSSYSKYYNKVKNCVNSTKGIVLTYNGKYIYAAYHSTSNGKTEDALNVWGKSYPYLKSVSSTWDKNVSSYKRVVTKEFNNLNKVLGLNINSDSKVVIKRNASHRVSSVKIDSKSYSGVAFRNLLGLRSSDFDIAFKNGKVSITTRGYGHGVGMSQYGANEMAKKGKTYKQILTHYYRGVSFKKI